MPPTPQHLLIPLPLPRTGPSSPVDRCRFFLRKCFLIWGLGGSADAVRGPKSAPRRSVNHCLISRRGCAHPHGVPCPKALRSSPRSPHAPPSFTGKFLGSFSASMIRGLRADQLPLLEKPALELLKEVSIGAVPVGLMGPGGPGPGRRVASGVAPSETGGRWAGMHWKGGQVPPPPPPPGCPATVSLTASASSNGICNRQ